MWVVSSAIEFEDPLSEANQVRVRASFERMATLNDLDATSLRYRMQVTGRSPEEAWRFIHIVNLGTFGALGIQGWRDRLTRAQRDA